MYQFYENEIGKVNGRQIMKVLRFCLLAYVQGLDVYSTIKLIQD